MNPHSDSLDGSATARLASPVLDPSEPSNPPPVAAAQGPKPAGPRLGWLLLIVLIVAAVAFAAGYFPRSKERAAVKSDTRELAVPTVDVTSPAPAKAAPPLQFSGEVKPLTEAAIHARASGYVRRWLVDIGARVEQGQLLAELDTPELDRDLAQGRAELAQSEAALALAETTAKRWTEMRAAKTVSPQEADEKIADLALKKATVEAAHAKVQRLEQMAGFNKITAPFAGTVTMRTLDVGQLVTTAAGRELFRIAQADMLRVFVRVPQNYARAVTVGQVAELVFTELPGRTFEAKVVRTAGTLDAAGEDPGDLFRGFGILQVNEQAWRQATVGGGRIGRDILRDSLKSADDFRGSDRVPQILHKNRLPQNEAIDVLDECFGLFVAILSGDEDESRAKVRADFFHGAVEELARQPGHLDTAPPALLGMRWSSPSAFFGVASNPTPGLGASFGWLT